MPYLGQEMNYVDFDDNKIRVGLIRSSVHSPCALFRISVRKKNCKMITLNFQNNTVERKIK